MRYLVTLFCLFSCILATNAQDIKRPDSYNYTRGVEALQQENFKEALEYLNKEVDENPKNGYAFAWLAFIYNTHNEYGQALTASDKAVKLVPKKDKEYRSFALNVHAQIYVNLEKPDNALKDYAQSIKENPDESDTYKYRAQLYYEKEEYDLSDNDYKQMIRLDQGDVMGYMGLGRNANAQGKYTQAIEHYDYVIKLAPEYSSGYSFRGECFLRQGKYNEAATDIVKALDIDNNNKAFYHMQELADSSITSIATKLRVQASKDPTEGSWPYYLGIVYEHRDNYNKAVGYYKDALKLDNNPIIEKRISNCYEELGNY